MRYDHKTIETKWQERWVATHAHEARDGDAHPKEYLLVEFPYPSGDGLHVGHIRPYVGLDVIARKRRMEGRNVLYPFGWDAFGLPTENYAIKMGIHPAVATERNIATFKRQIQALGISFDWSREVNTTDPAYYKWTQWIFLQLLKHGLAYKARIPINWCPSCTIGLANEEAVGGVCDRCSGPVEKRDKEQWMLKITAYAEKLLAGLDTVDYIERAKVQQVNWIGRSEGATIGFQISNFKFQISVFTTRPDTLFGATYLVLAPEHAAISNLSSKGGSASGGKSQISNWSEVEAYIAVTRRKTEIERTAEEKEKTGVELKGIKAVNPANGEEIPVWVADYVLAHYGTGAIMAVPAHDERDFAFAKKYELPITRVIARRADGHRPDVAIPSDEEVYIGDGILVNSGKFTGMASEDAKRAITEHVGGKMTVTYKLRDWVFSRQRYWGEPIPVVFCTKCGTVPVPEDQLPVLLPQVERYQPTETGDSPLATIAEWVNTTCPQCGGPAKRETDVMPNWAGSSWYFLAYLMRGVEHQKQHSHILKNVGMKSSLPFPMTQYREAFAYWMPVDWYNGGMEHTTLHLLYSRFWNIFLHDIGVVPVAEPYAKRTSHGLILASDGEKMSKSRGNVVSPDEIVERFGADAVRLYEMFIGPFDQPVPWSTDGLVGCRRFLERVVALAEKVGAHPRSGDLQVATDRGGLKPSATGANADLIRLTHRTIKKVTDDIEAMRFNTAVSALMECANAFGKQKMVPGTIFETFLRLLAPFAPHLAEELLEVVRSRSGGLQAATGGSNGGLKPSATEFDQSKIKNHQSFIFSHPWPSYDPTLIVEDEIDLVVQVNGKVRATVRVPADITETDARARASVEPNVAKYFEGKQLKKIIFVPQRLINFVV